LLIIIIIIISPMKKLFLTVLICFAAILLYAQNGYIFPGSGKTNVYKMSVESTMGSNTMIVKQSCTKSDSGQILLKTESTDLKGGEVTPTAVIAFNENEKNYTIPLNDLMKSQLAAFENLQIVDSYGNLSWPKELNVGDKLEKTTIKIKATIQGMDIEAVISMDNREVIGKETIEVPAGKFDCIKVKESIIIDMMGQQITNVSTECYAKEIGLVKQITDTMGGMATTTMELQEIK
jgi:hypothetical protein